MPDWMPQLLLLVFVTHLPLFAWRWHRTGELRFAAMTLTFALLVTVYGLRVFAPDPGLRGTPLHEWARIPALLSAAVSLSLLARHLRRKRANRRG